jgi:hypothetical protein
MKKIKKPGLLFLSLLLNCIASPSTVCATTYYVSPTGTTAAAGSISEPLSFTAAIAKSLTGGDSLILRGGLYSFSTLQQISKSGLEGNLLQIVAYPNETPILDFRTQSYNSSNQGVKISGSYIRFTGIFVQGAGDNGIQVTGSNNVIEHCTARWNCDSGFQFKTGSDNLILNCDSYENFDYESGGTSSPDYGGNADGFADKQYTNTGTNTYKGCRAWRNGDDGWDSYEKVGNTVYDSCTCYAMAPDSFDMTNHIRFKTDSASWFYQFRNASGRYLIKNYGNGNGFKLGGNYTANNATLHNCISVSNAVKGFDQNNNNGTMILYNCISYNNQTNYGFQNSSYGTLIIKNCASLNSAKSNSFNCKQVTQDHNSWNTGFSCTSADFVSLDFTQILNDRQADGSLPEVTFLHLVSTSGMIDQGTDVGLAYKGSAPDLGAYEYASGLTNIPASPVAGLDVYLSYSSSDQSLTITGSLSFIELFKVSGQRMYAERTSSDKVTISTTGWPTGIYLAYIVCMNGTSGTRKILIN